MAAAGLEEGNGRCEEARWRAGIGSLYLALRGRGGGKGKGMPALVQVVG